MVNDIIAKSGSTDTPLVTVAMSVYNVEQFVRDAVNAIINQSYRHLEVIIIDDASTDNTLDVLKEFADMDSRIRIIQQESNQGLSVSRNRAISEAKGKYIIMLDGDDMFDLTMVEKGVAKAESSDADMVIWDYIIFKDPTEIPSKVTEKSGIKDISDLKDNKLRHALVKRPGFMWTRMIKVSSLRTLGVNFPIGLTKQDIPVHWQLCTRLKRIEILPERLAYYRLQPNATSCRKGKSLFALATVMDLTGEYLKSEELYEEYFNEYWIQRLSLLHGMYDFIIPELKGTAMELIIERINGSDANRFLESSKNLLTTRTKSFYGMIRGSILATIYYKVFILLRKLYRDIKG